MLMLPVHGGLGSQDSYLAVLAELPTIEEICLAPIATRDFVGKGLLPKAEREFLACVTKILLHNRSDAWDHVGTGADTVAHQRCRLAWTELWMFSKTCLSVLPGGQAKKQRNANITANRLDRWAGGERKSLWDEVLPKASGSRRKNASDSEAAQQHKRQEAAVSLARRGLPGKAVQRLSGPGLAANTPLIEGIMRSKFVDPLPHQATSTRPPTPASNILSEESVVSTARSFKKGAGPGPSGLRPDFVKQVVGEGVRASRVRLSSRPW